MRDAAGIQTGGVSVFCRARGPDLPTHRMRLAKGLDIALRRLERLQAPEDMESYTCTWRGIQFPCIVSTEHRGETVQLGGEMVEVSLTIIIRKAVLDPRLDASSIDVSSDSIELTADNDLLPPAPNHDIELTTRNRTYRIAQVRFDGPASHYSLDCVDPYRP